MGLSRSACRGFRRRRRALGVRPGNTVALSVTVSKQRAQSIETRCYRRAIIKGEGAIVGDGTLDIVV